MPIDLNENINCVWPQVAGRRNKLTKFQGVQGKLILKTFLNEMHISAFQQLQHSPSQTDGDGLQMAHGVSRCVNGPRGLHNPLTQPPPSEP